MVLDNFPYGLLHLVRDSALRDFSKKTSVRRREMSTELAFPADNLINRDGVEQTVDTSIYNWDLKFNWKRLVLALLCAGQQT